MANVPKALNGKTGCWRYMPFSSNVKSYSGAWFFMNELSGMISNLNCAFFTSGWIDVAIDATRLVFWFPRLDDKPVRPLDCHPVVKFLLNQICKVAGRDWGVIPIQNDRGRTTWVHCVVFNFHFHFDRRSTFQSRQRRVVRRRHLIQARSRLLDLRHQTQTLFAAQSALLVYLCSRRSFGNLAIPSLNLSSTVSPRLSWLEPFLSTILFESFLTIFKDFLAFISAPEASHPGLSNHPKSIPTLFAPCRISLQSNGVRFLTTLARSSPGSLVNQRVEDIGGITVVRLRHHHQLKRPRSWSTTNSAPSPWTKFFSPSPFFVFHRRRPRSSRRF